MTHSTPLIVAVVGATGVVGRTMVAVLGERGFPIGELRLLVLLTQDGHGARFGRLRGREGRTRRRSGPCWARRWHADLDGARHLPTPTW